MIGEALISLFLSTFRLLFNGMEFIKLPVETISALSTLIVYGNWVVGVDILALFAGSVVFWWGVHLSIGLAVWVWNQLPLT